MAAAKRTVDTIPVPAAALARLERDAADDDRWPLYRHIEAWRADRFQNARYDLDWVMGTGRAPARAEIAYRAMRSAQREERMVFAPDYQGHGSYAQGWVQRWWAARERRSTDRNCA